MPFSSEARSRLSEQFAEIFRVAQEEYREVLNALRNDDVTFDEFNGLTSELMDKLLKLKRIRIHLTQEKGELERRSDGQPQ
jgi:hypothetical protein